MKTWKIEKLCRFYLEYKGIWIDLPVMFFLFVIVSLIFYPLGDYAPFITYPLCFLIGYNTRRVLRSFARSYLEKLK